MPSSFFRPFLRHGLLAGSALCVALLLVEWLLPGGVGSRLPLVPAAFGWAVFVVAASVGLRPFGRRLPAFLAFLLPLSGAGVALALFAIRTGLSTMLWAAALAGAIAALAAAGFFLPEGE